MTWPKPEVGKQPCAFLAKIESPLITLGEVIEFIQERKVKVENIYFHLDELGEAILILQCIIERDRIKYTYYGLEKVKGILELELLESRVSGVFRK